MKRPLRWTPLTLLVVGFGFSLAANLLWTWQGGPVRILGGAFASIALPAAIHLFPHIQAPGWVTKSLRNLVMALISVLAAATTFSHASSLLMAHGELEWLAWAYPAMSELLVVFAVLALRAPAGGRNLPPEPATYGDAEEMFRALDQPEPEPAAPAKRRRAARPAKVTPALLEKVAAFKADNPEAGRTTVMAEFKLSDYQAKQALAATNGHSR